MKSKKGSIVPLEAIIGVAIALLVFIPACVMVSKFFRTSEQAQQSFHNFVKELSFFSGNEKKSDVAVLKMDAGTAIIGFTRNSPVSVHGEINVLQEQTPTSPSVLRSSGDYFSVPSQCTSFPCVCLCQEFSSGQDSKLEIDNVFISRQQLVCKQFICENVPQLKLGQDFAVIRETQSQARRVEVSLTKANGVVMVTTQ